MNDLTARLAQPDSSALFELATDGTVLDAHFRRDDRLSADGPRFAGANFFAEAAALGNVSELERAFRRFVRSRRFTDQFIFSAQDEQRRRLRLKVMFVRAFRANGRTGAGDPEGIVIMDVKNNST